MKDKLGLMDLTGKTYDQINMWFIKRRQKVKQDTKTAIFKYISPAQKTILQLELAETDHPGPVDLERLQLETKLSKKQIINWFSYERRKKKLQFC
jgi:hypothetical protein